MSPPLETSKALPSSGYYRDEDSLGSKTATTCAFDCGESWRQAYTKVMCPLLHTAMQMRCLLNSLLLENQFWLKEGFHTYFGPLAWHRHFREEAAHNTIKMGEHTQAEYCERLTWKSVINPKLQYWRNENNLQAVCGEIVYDAETCHRREILAIASRFWVLSDRLQSAGQNEKAIAYFHLDSSVALEIDRVKKQITAGHGDGGLLIQYFEDYEVEAWRGEEGMGPENGWQAEGYGYKKPTWVLSFSIPLSQKTVLFPLLLLPWKGGKPTFSFEEDEPLSSNSEDLYHKSFSFDQQDYVVSFREHDSPFVQCNGVAFEKEMKS